MTDRYDEEAKEVIAKRANRLKGVTVDIAHISWLREVADELTRLRYDLRRQSAKEGDDHPASPEAP